MRKILVIDDDQDICRLLTRFLIKKGFEAQSAHNATDATNILKKTDFDLVLCDYKLPDATGLELLQKIKIINQSTAVIIITGYSDIKIAVETLRHGAYDYVTKPLFPDEILITINNAIDKKEQKLAGIKKGKPAKVTGKKFIKGESPQSKIIQKHVNLIAPTDMSVIITGETGTGKEYIANAIHQKSNRADQPFIAIDCGAIPKELAGSELFGHMKGAFTGAINDKMGSFETANRGTLFLDEIGNLSYDNQVKLLRVLQEKKIKRIGSNQNITIDVRVIVATNDNLKKAVRDNVFREDIYHRLNEFQIELSPLRERKDDILLFARHFLENANQQLSKNIHGFDENVLERLMNYQWHGNLRELQNVIKRAVLLCQTELITIDNLPTEIITPAFFENNSLDDDLDVSGDKLKAAAANAEKQVILKALKNAGFNKSKAAKDLNIDRKTLYNKLKAYEIQI